MYQRRAYTASSAAAGAALTEESASSSGLPDSGGGGGGGGIAEEMALWGPWPATTPQTQGAGTNGERATRRTSSVVVLIVYSESRENIGQRTSVLKCSSHYRSIYGSAAT